MKQTPFSLFQKSRPVLFAAFGYTVGLLFFALVGYKAFDYAEVPLLSAFSTSAPLIALIADFAKEASLFALGALASLFLSTPLPSLAVLAWRSFLFGLSAAYLFGSGVGGLPLYLAYVAVNTAIVVSYAAIAASCSKPLNKKGALSDRLWQTLFPLCYFTGVILLLVVIRHLTYLLFLPR